MRGGGATLGFIGLIALVVGAYYLWVAILYVGIPLAILGGGVTIYLLRKYPDFVSMRHKDAGMREGAIVLAIGSVLLGSVSLVGNIFTQQGPFSKANSVTAASLDTQDEEASARAAQCRFYATATEKDVQRVCLKQVNSKAVMDRFSTTDRNFAYIGCSENMKEEAKACRVTPSWD